MVILLEGRVGGGGLSKYPSKDYYQTEFYGVKCVPSWHCPLTHLGGISVHDRKLEIVWFLWCPVLNQFTVLQCFGSVAEKVRIRLSRKTDPKENRIRIRIGPSRDRKKKLDLDPTLSEIFFLQNVLHYLSLL